MLRRGPGYEQAGRMNRSPHVWLIQPRERTVAVYRPGRSVRLLRDTDRLEGEDVLPGFSVLVGEILN